MKNVNQSPQNRSINAACPQAERNLIRYRRISLGKSGTRLQFYKGYAKCYYLDLTPKMMRWIDKWAEAENMTVVRIIFSNIGSMVVELEKIIRFQGRIGASLAKTMRL
jgi:hypothetical protein